MLSGYEEYEVLAILNQRLHMVRSQANLARELKVSPQYLADILTERRPISAKLAQRLGLQRTVIFRPAV